jgi:septal ring factor EnvC (AmiA/AmiB activator)
LVLLHKIIMDERNWFEKKWGILSDVPTDSLIKRIEELEERMLKLEEENVETTNTLYEIMHDIDAVDARIDILHTHNDE